LNHDQTIWDKNEVLLGMSLGTFWVTLGIFWEPNENTLGTNKNQNPPPSPKTHKKNIMPPNPFHWLHEIFISKKVCQHFQL
jgi:hypothetical protein